MRYAITGGAGFFGTHAAATLRRRGHEVVLISRRTGIDIGDPAALLEAFEGCDGILHCAGINREIGAQRYQAVHVEGTRTVIEAARAAGVDKLVSSAFCGPGRSAVAPITRASSPRSSWFEIRGSTTPCCVRGWSTARGTTCSII